MTLVELNNLIRRTDNFTIAQMQATIADEDKERMLKRIADILEKKHSEILITDESSDYSAYSELMDLAEKALLLNLPPWKLPIGFPKTVAYAGDVVVGFAVEQHTEYDECDNETVTYTVNSLLGSLAARIQAIKDMPEKDADRAIAECTSYIMTCKTNALEWLPELRDAIVAANEYERQIDAARLHKIIYDEYISCIEVYYDHALRCLANAN